MWNSEAWEGEDGEFVPGISIDGKDFERSEMQGTKNMFSKLAPGTPLHEDKKEVFNHVVKYLHF